MRPISAVIPWLYKPFHFTDRIGQAINVVQVYQTRLAVSPVQPNLLIAVAGYRIQR